MMLFANSKVEIYAKAEDRSRYGLIVKDHRLARKVNKAMNHYPPDTKFVKGEEVTFTFLPAQIKSIANTDPKLARILAYILGPLN